MWKTLRSQKLRMLLTRIANCCSRMGTSPLRTTCAVLCVTSASRSEWWGSVKFEARVEELVESLPDLAGLVEPLLIVRRVLCEQLVILHRRLSWPSSGTMRCKKPAPDDHPRGVGENDFIMPTHQSGEAIIRYGFHPRCGETVIVTGRNRHGDEVALTIRQPDGTLAQLPIWMTEDRAVGKR